MKAQVKQIVNFVIRSLVGLSPRLWGAQYLFDQILQTLRESVAEVSHRGMVFRFPVPNALSVFRVNTFSSKEPETLEWIDSIPAGSIFWDIGANVGLYSVYAAKTRNCKVWAFEPSVFNIELLARGLFLNEVTDQVCIVPLAISNKLASSHLHMTTTDWGGALSTFDQKYGYDGKELKEKFNFQTVGMSMVDAVNRMGIPQPDYIKIDVDGIEHLILNAGADVLSRVKGLLVEINDDFKELADQSHQALTDAGLVLSLKLHSEMFDNSEAFGHLYNQIWVRP